MSKINSQIINGEALTELSKLPLNSIDFVLADLPFEQTAQNWDKMLDHKVMWRLLQRVVKPDAALCFFASGLFSHILTTSNLKNFRYKWIWWKNRSSNFLQANIRPLNVIEEILVFSFGSCPYFPQKSQGHTPTKFSKRKADSSTVYNRHSDTVHAGGNTERYPTNVLVFDCVNNDAPNRFHPNQKPVDLLQYLIRTYTKKRQTVLDLTAGSFSTGEACAIENRNFIGIEQDETLCEIGKVRIERMSGNIRDYPQKKNTDKAKTPLFG